MHLPLETWTFQAGSVTLEMESVPSIDPLIDDDLDLEHPPYWPVVWPSAHMLARWLIEQEGSERPGARPASILELGCGAGLVGLVASRLGAAVVQTDYIVEALELARRNARRNGIAGIRRVVADWRRWPLRQQFPLVLGSDVTYERSVHGALAEVLDQALAPGGVACLADPARPPSLAFFAALETAGWEVEMTEPAADTCDTPLFLYFVRRPANHRTPARIAAPVA